MSVSCSTIVIVFLTDTFSLFLQFLSPSQNTVTKQNFFIIEQLCGHEVLIKILHFLIIFYVYFTFNVEFLQNLYIHSLVNYLPNLIDFNNYRDRVSHSLSCLASWYFQCYEISQQHIYQNHFYQSSNIKTIINCSLMYSYFCLFLACCMVFLLKNYVLVIMLLMVSFSHLL